MLKKISQWLGGLSGTEADAGQPLAQLCLFGKHPGWDDHMQDMGLATERLVGVRRSLYAEGIAGNIDTGTWEKLPAPGRLEKFDHAFVWRSAGGSRGEFVYGRLWSSRDARGRTKYPMIACVHARGIALSQIAPKAAETATRTMEACRQEEDAQSVRSIFLRESEALKARVSGIEGVTDDWFDRTCRGNLAADGSLAENGYERLVRAAYALHREAAPALKQGFAELSRGVHVRLPRVEGMGIGGSAWAWTAGVLDLLGRPEGIPEGVLAIEAIDAGWVDVLLGKVTPSELLCLRATPATIPLTTDVPFTIEAAFADKVRSRVAIWRGDSVSGEERARGGRG